MSKAKSSSRHFRDEWGKVNNRDIWLGLEIDGDGTERMYCKLCSQAKEAFLSAGGDKKICPFNTQWCDKKTGHTRMKPDLIRIHENNDNHKVLYFVYVVLYMYYRRILWMLNLETFAGLESLSNQINKL